MRQSFACSRSIAAGECPCPLPADKTGVATITDPRFNTTFEDVFTNPSLQGPEYKFYIVGGVRARHAFFGLPSLAVMLSTSAQNHDHLGNITAQVDYSRTSTRWVFPAEYYTFTKKTSDGATIEVRP